MFETIMGENVEVPFGVLFQSILTMSSPVSSGPFLRMRWDENEDMLTGFEVVYAEETNEEEITASARDRLGIPWKGN